MEYQLKRFYNLAFI